MGHTIGVACTQTSLPNAVNTSVYSLFGTFLTAVQAGLLDYNSFSSTRLSACYRCCLGLRLSHGRCYAVGDLRRNSNSFNFAARTVIFYNTWLNWSAAVIG